MLISMSETQTALEGICFRLDEATGKLFADIQPQADRPVYQRQDIEAQLSKDSFADLALHEDAIDGLLKTLQENNQPVQIEIGARRDAEYLFDISDDGMLARLSLLAAKGGKAANLQDLEAAMQEAGIRNGKIVEAMQQAVSDGHADKLAIARGREAESGEDSRFEVLYEESIERRPELDDKGRANYHALGNIATVEAGDPVMRRHPPTEGKPGLTVSGEQIAAQPGENILYATGMQGVRIDNSDPDMLYATIAGHPVAFENGVNVDSLYIVDAVDLNTGNIDFDGSIKVNHDVRQGVSIKAKGDIFIGGTVEAANIEAGGDIEISGGIIGHLEHHEEDKQRDWSTRIHAGKTLRINFAENAELAAGKKILVAEVVTRCELHAEDSIIVGTEGCRKGHILGGELYANNRIQAVVAGSQASIPTHLHAGYKIADLVEKIDTLKKEISLKEELLLKLAELSRRLESGQMQDNGDLKDQARSNIDAVKAAIAERRNAIDKLNVQIQQLRKATIEIGKQAYTNVHGYIGDEEHRLGDETTAGIFQLQGGKVVYIHR